MRTHTTDRIARFAGSLSFFYLNAVWFTLWIGINVFLPWHFDNYPFAFLTLSVSLEAIFLTIFVLIAQNRQTEADRRIAEQDCATNARAEHEIRLLMEHMERQDATLQTILAQLATAPMKARRRKTDEVSQ